MTAKGSMLSIFAGIGVAAVALTALGAGLGGVLGWLLAVVAGLVALVAVGTFVFSMWGRYVGLPWLFTP